MITVKEAQNRIFSNKISLNIEIIKVKDSLGRVTCKNITSKIFNFIRSMTFEPFAPPSFYIGKKKYLIVAEKQVKKIKFTRSPK